MHIFEKAVKKEQRICFGIMWFDNEADAIEAAQEVKNQNRTYNGGFFHGMECGRDKSFDGPDRYAVTY